jgi:hypothetical protein
MGFDQREFLTQLEDDLFQLNQSRRFTEPYLDVRVEVASDGLRTVRQIEDLVSGVRVLVEVASSVAYKKLAHEVALLWKEPSEELVENVNLFGKTWRVGVRTRDDLREYDQAVPRGFRDNSRRRKGRNHYPDFASLEEFSPLAYAELCTETVRLLLPSPLLVRSLHYGSPLKFLFKGGKAAARTVPAALGVAKDVRDWQSEKIVGEQRARRVVETTDANIAADKEHLELDIELKKQELEGKKLDNILKQEQIRQARDDGDYERMLRQISLNALSRGEREAADSYRELPPRDLRQLRELSGRLTIETTPSMVEDSGSE